MKKLFICFAAALGMLLPAHSSAAPIDFVDRGSYTTDNLSRLDWLDVTLTSGLSFGAVNATLLGSGQIYEDWRYATMAEAAEMLSNYSGASVDAVHGGINNAGVGAFNGLSQLIGISSQNSNHFRIAGLLNTVYPGYPGTYTVGEFYDVKSLFLQDQYKFSSYAYSNWSSSYGSFLVRETLHPVPIPASLPLMAAGLAIFALARRPLMRRS